MKIQVELDLTISAKAVYRNGQLSVITTGTMPYANREASATIEGASKETIELFTKAFEALLEEQKQKVLQATQVAHSEALSVAARMGEL